MGMILRTSSFLLVATLCHAKHGCEQKIDAINKNALSLEVQCQEIQTQADALVAGGCCGGGSGGGDCVCAPTPIIDGTDPIVVPRGVNCLTADLATKSLNASDGAVIDLNGHTVYNVFGDSNFTVKNGTILNELAGNDNIVGYGLNVPRISGGPGSITLVDCTGLIETFSVDDAVLVRCSGGDGQLEVTQSHHVSIIDSYFGYRIVVDQDLQSFKMYRSTVRYAENDPYKRSLYSISGMTNLSEFMLYESTLGGVLLGGAYTNPVHMLIESSMLDNCEFGDLGGVTRFSSGLVTRSLLGQTLCNQSVGLTFNACEIVGEFSFNQCENIECDNDSVYHVGNANNDALIVIDGRSIVVRDCFAIVDNNHAGYSFNGETASLAVLNCYAKGCPIGFFINNPTDGFMGVIKECVADGCSQASYKQSNGQASLFAYGNVAISKSAAPVANYDTNALVSFNPLATSLTAIETDTVTSWRNISFELP